MGEPTEEDQQCACSRAEFEMLYHQLNGWAEEVLGMIAARLEVLGCQHPGLSHQSTPPMFYDDWIACVVGKREAENARLRERAEALAEALRNQGLLQNTFHGTVWHIYDCPASFDFSECHYRCRVAQEAFALAGTEPYVSQEIRTEVGLWPKEFSE